ncbi:hypothetical protein [Variovorax sp. GT1P44]|uniref:hypothetical protein n=1 Tax=Variovorax sp. GT1P44 TaxID=3443742 RepID=UPI003F477B15
MTTVSRFDEIVFTDDFFRSVDNTLQSHPSNRRFLFRALGLQAERLGIHCNEIAALSDGGELDVAAMMGVLGLPRDPHGWAKTALADLQPLEESGLIPRFTSTTLVIGWGMPPSLMRHVDRCGASFIDLEIAPIRFGAHLAFCARTNDRLIEETLEGWRIGEEDFWNEAAVLKGYFARRGSSNIFDKDLSVGLFCGQTSVDLALVQNGEIARPADVIEQVRQLARQVDILAIKPHPNEESLGHLEHLAANIPNAAWTDANIYGLLASDNLSFVCGLSSGALQEADYFMKRSFRLISPDRNNRTKLPPNCSDWIPIGPRILSLQGMAKICSVAGPATGRISSVQEDALDRAFGMRWGLDPNNPGLNNFPQLTLDHAYDICAGRDATAWLTFGWSSPEAAGVWTVGERACIVIPLRADAFANEKTISITLHGTIYAPSPSRAPTVRAWLNGQRANVQIRDGRTQLAGTTFRFLRPDADPQVKALVIELDIADPLRPTDFGHSGDSRRLGFNLQKLSVERESPRDQRDTMQASPMPHRERESGKNTAKGWAVAATCALLAGVAAFHGGGPDGRREEANASAWIELKHSVSAGIDTIRGDLQALFWQHHA